MSVCFFRDARSSMLSCNLRTVGETSVNMPSVRLIALKGGSNRFCREIAFGVRVEKLKASENLRVSVPFCRSISSNEIRSVEVVSLVKMETFRLLTSLTANPNMSLTAVDGKDK